MNKSIRLLLIVVTAILFQSSMGAQTVLSSKLSKDTILIGDQVEWETKINIPKEYTLSFDSLSNPVTPGVELIGKFYLDTLSMKKKIVDIKAVAVLTSFDSGTYFIPSRIVDVLKDGEVVDTLHIKSQFLEVTTIPVDTASFQMKDIKPQYRYPIKVKEVLPWAGGWLFLLLFSYLLYRLITNRRQNKTIFGRPIVKDPPHIVALRTLEHIRSEKLWQNNKEKQFYTEIMDAIRLYIEGRYSLQAMESTSGEILEMLKKETIPTSEFEELTELFSVADMVKFAKHKASDADNEKAIPTAVRFVNATFLQEMEEQKNG